MRAILSRLRSLNRSRRCLGSRSFSSGIKRRREAPTITQFYPRQLFAFLFTIADKFLPIENGGVS
jgi:hypothetical protein